MKKCFHGLLTLLTALTLFTSPELRADGETAWWKLDGRLDDAVGGVKLAPVVQPEYAERAMAFDGEKQFLSARDAKHMDMGKSDFTLEATFKLAQYPPNHAFIIGKGNKGYGGYYYLAVLDSGCIRARIYDDNDPPNQGSLIIGVLPIELEEWYHIIAAYDRDLNLSVYINGRLAGNVDISKVGDVDNTEPFQIGMLWTQFFPGKIADVRVYRRALSISEAKERFKAAVERRGNIFAKVGIPDTVHFDWKRLTAEEAAKDTRVVKGNLLANSSFEGLAGVERLSEGSKWWAAGGPIMRRDGRHGPTCVRTSLVSDPIPYKAGIPHTLSFYARDPKGGSATLRVRHSHGFDKYQQYDKYTKKKKVIPHVTFKCKLTEKWQRFSFSFRPGVYVMSPRRNFVIDVSGGSKALFDAFQLEHGGLSDYSPKPLELFVNIPRRDDRSRKTYFFEDEKVALRAVATGQVSRKVSATMTVRDFWMKPVYTQELKIRIADGAVSGVEAVNIPALPKGCYRVYLEGEGVRARSVIFACIGRDLREPAEIMGASHSAGMSYNARFTDDFGITWTRDHAAYWGPSSSRPEIDLGHPEFFEREDRELAQKRKNPKLRYWASFFYPPLKWKKYHHKAVYENGFPGPIEDAFLLDMAAHMRAMVKKYGQTVKYWECWNEPSGHKFPFAEYLKMLKEFNRAVKETDSDAVVVGFSGFLELCHWDNWMVPLMQMGALKYCDVISFHGYFNEWAEDVLWGNKSLAAYLDFIQDEARKVGKPDMPIWDNEFTLWGESWYDDERPRAVALPLKPRWGRLNFDYRQSVSQIVHYVTIGYAHGVRHFGPHCFTHPGSEVQGQQRIEYIQPAWDYDGSIKPKTVAYAVICHKMNGARLVAERIDGDLHVYVFSIPRGSLAVVFMRHGKKAKLKLPDAKDLDFRNVFDAPFADVAKRGSRVVISLVGEPVYVESTRTGEALARALVGISILRPSGRSEQ